MTKHGLRTRILILTLAPAFLTGLLLSSYFIYERYSELENQLTLTGQAIIEPLALASEIGLVNESRESVRRLIGHAHRQHSEYVRNIAIFTKDNRLFATSNYHRNLEMLTLSDAKSLPERLTFETKNGRLLLRAPIRANAGFNTSINSKETVGYICMEMDSSSIKIKQYQNIMAAGVMLILGLIASIIFAYRLLTYVVVPIKQMISMIDSIRRGHLDVRVEGKLSGELDSLKNGINAMAMSLSENHLEMQQSIDQATSDLRATLDKMEVQNVELDIAKRNAQEAARVKSEFLANMSHELRTPLNSILGFTRQMLKSQLNTNQVDYLQTIEKSANNLLGIINDILDFSKLDANKLQLESIKFDFEDSLDDVLLLLAPMAHEKGLELNLRIDPKIPLNLIGDPLRIQQILTNIIGNATKFTQCGYISVSVEFKQQFQNKVYLQFTVKDTGIGISEDQQSQLFQAFKQADASISRHYGGTGLGLVITKKLIRRMGGDIGFSSRLHQGSSFWFTLTLQSTESQNIPILQQAWCKEQSIMLVEPDNLSRQYLFERLSSRGFQVYAHACIPEQVKEVSAVLYCMSLTVKPDLTRLLEDFQKAKSASDKVIFCLPTSELTLSETLLDAGVNACLAKPVPIRKILDILKPQAPLLTPLFTPPQQKPAKKKIAIMAVDDNEANLKLIFALLEEHVTKIVLASSGQKAVEEASKQAFDLIFMDIQMPEMDGVTASKEIRATSLNAFTPIIAVTAHALEGEREKLLSEGIDDYLTKPIDEHMLENMLCTWANHKKVGPFVVKENKALPPPRIEHIDWAFAVKQAMGKKDIAEELLTMLVASFDEVKIAINESLAGKDVELCSLIHKLHGSSAYSGVPILKQLCFDIETLLKKGALIEDIEPELFELIDEMQTIKRLAPSFLTAPTAPEKTKNKIEILY